MTDPNSTDAATASSCSPSRKNDNKDNGDADEKMMIMRRLMAMLRVMMTRVGMIMMMMMMMMMMVMMMMVSVGTCTTSLEINAVCKHWVLTCRSYMNLHTLRGTTHDPTTQRSPFVRFLSRTQIRRGLRRPNCKNNLTNTIRDLA